MAPSLSLRVLTFVALSSFSAIVSAAPTSKGLTTCGWVYEGCFADTATNHLLSVQVDPSTTEDTSLENCQSACYSRGYNISGTENGYQCWCDHGPVPASIKSEVDSYCNTPCYQNANETCGGYLAVSIYYDNCTIPSAVTVTVTKAPVTTPVITVTVTATPTPIRTTTAPVVYPTTTAATCSDWLCCYLYPDYCDTNAGLRTTIVNDPRQTLGLGSPYRQIPADDANIAARWWSTSSSTPAPTSALGWSTSTIYTTTTFTITSCPPTVTACPVGKTTTSTISLSTTLCPITASTVPTAAPVVPTLQTVPVAPSVSALPSAPPPPVYSVPSVVVGASSPAAPVVSVPVGTGSPAIPVIPITPVAPQPSTNLTTTLSKPTPILVNSGLSLGADIGALVVAVCAVMILL